MFAISGADRPGGGGTSCAARRQAVIDFTWATVSRAWRSKTVPMRSVLCCLALAACTASSEEVRPNPDELFFPTGAAVSPDERFMFVANANSELRYDSGTVVMIDLAKVDEYVTNWTMGGTTGADCHMDPDHRETMECLENVFILPAASARIGNFATDIAVQDTGSGTLRLIVPTRGDPSIAWLDFDGSRLSCNADAQGFALCDEAHRLSYVHGDPDLLTP